MGKKILIIDEERDLCALIERAMSRDGFEIDCAYSLEEAGKKLEGGPDIIILDHNLPDGLGLDYLHSNRDAFHDAGIIMVTADADPEIRLEAKNEGVLGFLQKPFSMREIRELVRLLI